jgi:uncharacterized protein YecE (DUF72 family)
MARILVGTASWTDRTLVQSGWYPKGVSSAEERLRFYTRHFPLVEVDSTYYFLPTDQAVSAWRDRTPPGFKFDLKAFSLLTRHPTDPKALPAGMAPVDKPRVYLTHLDRPSVDAVWDAFVGSLEPLRRAHKVGAVLFQFPPWFSIKRANKDYIIECKERARPLGISVELRHPSWFTDANRAETLAFFREHRIPLVSVDTVIPVPPLDESTSRRLAVVRLHGRGGPRPGLTPQAAAGAYRYSPSELQTWVPIVQRLASRAQSVHVVFRNAYKDYAVGNAAQFQQMLHASGLRAA